MSSHHHRKLGCVVRVVAVYVMLFGLVVLCIGPHLAMGQLLLHADATKSAYLLTESDGIRVHVSWPITALPKLNRLNIDTVLPTTPLGLIMIVGGVGAILVERRADRLAGEEEWRRKHSR